MLLKFQCPRCGKSERSELVEVLQERKYRMKYEDCQYIHIVTARRRNARNQARAAPEEVSSPNPFQ